MHKVTKADGKLYNSLANNNADGLLKFYFYNIDIKEFTNNPYFAINIINNTYNSI